MSSEWGETEEFKRCDARLNGVGYCQTTAEHEGPHMRQRGAVMITWEKVDIYEAPGLDQKRLPLWPCCGGRGKHTRLCANHPDVAAEVEATAAVYCQTTHPIHPAYCIRGRGHEGRHQLASGQTWGQL